MHPFLFHMDFLYEFRVFIKVMALNLELGKLEQKI